MTEKPTVVSLFSGCGGSSLGYKMAGFDVRLAVEWDNNAVASYKENFPTTTIYHGDIKKLSIEQALTLAKLKVGELDVLDGSPPCQGFSTAGKRKFNDIRNRYFEEYVRLLRELCPKAFVMENVSGMVKGKMRLIFVEALKMLKESGYIVSVRVLNSKWYGVPQSRQRTIFIGIRSELKINVTHPKPSSKPISARTALKDIVPEAIYELTDKPGKLWHKIKNGKSAQSVIGTEYNVSCLKINPNKPSNTICKTQGFKGYATLCHWEQPRAISVNEAKALQSFPKDFRLMGTKEQQWAMIGNSVPPVFMKAIAEHVRGLLSV
jgi:DNA (cytosine-5)-methyltransferase 1